MVEQSPKFEGRILVMVLSPKWLDLKIRLFYTAFHNNVPNDGIAA
jgi:hypothetical protein